MLHPGAPGEVYLYEQLKRTWHLGWTMQRHRGPDDADGLSLGGVNDRVGLEVATLTVQREVPMRQTEQSSVCFSR